jgi:prevent-host-death family protein
MTWNIASAKQQFSEVVRLTAEEPQAIYNRDKPVAVIISAQDFEDFQRWRAERDRPSLAQQFDEIRALFAADGPGWHRASSKHDALQRHGGRPHG